MAGLAVPGFRVEMLAYAAAGGARLLAEALGMERADVDHWPLVSAEPRD